MQQRTQLTIQINSITVDYDNLNARFEEEQENASSLRAQLSKLQTEFQALRTRYDKDMMAKTEELEDTRSLYILVNRFAILLQES